MDLRMDLAEAERKAKEYVKKNMVKYSLGVHPRSTEVDS